MRLLLSGVVVLFRCLEGGGGVNPQLTAANSRSLCQRGTAGCQEVLEGHARPGRARLSVFCITFNQVYSSCF